MKKLGLLFILLLLAFSLGINKAAAACLSGHYFEEGTCVYCPAGSYCINDVSTLCPAGYYCPRGTADYESYKCPAGTYSDVGSKSEADCQDCGFDYSQNV